ncbi:MAG: DUF4433 domain-containing protein [Lysobacterales bacterium]|nr:MAG: DUF4433 domain-containing protein [Xanthomonadales bacterium]
MTTSPSKPKIYHITHVDNLTSIVASGCIEADGRRVGQGGGQTSIGMTEIKRRRLYEIEISCHPGTMVGEYVPFYFCPRSIMLYILYRGNHPDMTYHAGQNPVLHLQVDMQAAINWADKHGVRWAFSDRNAGSYYTDFYNNLNDLDKIDWNAVNETDFRNPLIKEGKQAEFLIHEACAWHLVEKIGVFNQKIFNQVNGIISNALHKPVVNIERRWYY